MSKIRSDEEYIIIRYQIIKRYSNFDKKLFLLAGEATFFASGRGGGEEFFGFVVGDRGGLSVFGDLGVFLAVGDVGPEPAVQNLDGGIGKRAQHFVGRRLPGRGDQLQRPFAADGVGVFVLQRDVVLAVADIRPKPCLLYTSRCV